METAPSHLFENEGYISLVHSFNNDEDTSDKDNTVKIFLGLSWSLMIFYILFMLAASFNVYFFLIRQKRYKTLIVLLFYLLSYIVLIFRIAFFSTYILFFRGSTWPGNIILNNGSYIIATFAKVSLGFNQVISMLELALRLNTALKQDEENELQNKEKLAKKLKYLYISVGCIQVCVFGVCCYEVWATFQVSWYTENELEEFHEYAKRFAWISGFFYTLVTILLLVSYIILNSVIRKCGGFPTGELLTTMRTLFAIFFLSYFIRTFY